MSAPVLVEFLPGSRVRREQTLTSRLPVVGNGLPATFVLFTKEGWKVSLPTDQIVLAEDLPGFARVGFGGMRFDGLVNGMLQFTRVREVRRIVELSPERGQVMRLDPRFVVRVEVDGAHAWPQPS